MISIIPGMAFVGAVVGGTIGTFAGLAIGKATGSNTMSWGEVMMNTYVSLGISLVTAGMTKYLRISGVTRGSHSWQQVFKSGFTKTLRYGFNMSLKTMVKGVGYLLTSGFTTGMLLSSILQGLSKALKNKAKSTQKYYIPNPTFIEQG